MSFQKPDFGDYVYRPGDNINNLFESYFYQMGVFGGRKFKVIDGQEQLSLEKPPDNMTALDVVKTVVKFLSYFTLVIPLAMAIGKTIVRQQHKYTIVDEKSNKVTQEVANQTLKNIAQRDVWKDGIVPQQVWHRAEIVIPRQLEVEVEQNKKIENQEMMETIAHRKQGTNERVNVALQVVSNLRESINARDSNLIIKAESTQHNTSIVKGKLKDQEFEVTTYIKYKVRTWKFEVDGKKYEINEYKDGAYHGVKTEGFIERQRVLMNAARQYVESFLVNDEESYEAILGTYVEDLFQDIENKFLTAIWDMQIDPAIIQNPDRKVGQEHYDKIHAKAEKLLSQMARDVQYIIRDIPHSEYEGKQFNLNALIQIEKNYIISRGRPTIINTYFIPGMDVNDESSRKHFFSMHKPASTLDESGDLPRPMLPSTVRDREGLSNYVVTSYGELTKEGAKTRFQGVRHTSYPPITIRDPNRRQAIAFRNCKQNLTDLTASILDAHPERLTSQENPLVIPLRTMMLLSPQKNIDFFRNHKKFIAGKWTGESETLQMEEAGTALKMFNQRTIKVNVKGEDVWIKPNVSFMNLGANQWAMKQPGFGFLEPSRSYYQFNAKGFLEFENDVFDFVKGLLGEKSKLDPLLDKVAMYGNDDHLITAKTNLDKIQNTNNPQITTLYEELEKLSERYLNPEEDKRELTRSISRKKTEIEKLEEEIYNAAKAYTGLKTQIFLANKNKIFDLYQQINAELNLAQKDELDSDEKNRLKMASELLFKLGKGVTLYHTKAYRQAETVLDFQALYLELNEKMSNFVEFFCKSAKDRTGLLDSKLQGNFIFERMQGRPQLTAEDKKYIDNYIAPLVHQYSVSQNNSEQNTGARGLQISTITNQNLQAKIDKKNASLAKNIMSKAKKLNPSEWVVDRIKDWRTIT